MSGVLAFGLIYLALSGLYLRWPRHALAWRSWFKLDFSLTGRSFLWMLHSVLGTWILLIYLLLSVTGLYWSFDWVKDGANRMLGDAPREKVAKVEKKKTTKKTSPTTNNADLDLTPIWQIFINEVNKTDGYSMARLRLPEHAGDAIQVVYLDAHTAHERAFNKMQIQPNSGKISKQERYVEKDLGGRLLSSIYPLHMGTYFGITGRIIMMLASLALPLFGITGWMLYLGRRRKKRAVKLERAQLNASADNLATDNSATENILIAYTSQSGQAESIALRSAAALQAKNIAVSVISLATLNVERLHHVDRILFVVSTFGEGEPPDSARRFMKELKHTNNTDLSRLQYGILALGDSHYAQFCGFGHTLDHWLRSQNAQAQFAMISMDNADPVALTQWQDALQIVLTPLTASAPPSYQTWELSERRLLNLGSQGAPIFHLELHLPDAEKTTWNSGALVEILPRHAKEKVSIFMQRFALDGGAMVQRDGLSITLEQALSTSVLPNIIKADTTPQQIADHLQALAARRYSIASTPEDGSVHLLVRQVGHEDGLGIGSGWITEHAAIGEKISMRMLPNPSFALINHDAPCIFIGNGSGLAVLRGNLRARAQKKQHDNWLLFGERQFAHDFHYREEIEQWQKEGVLAVVDVAFSRDQTERVYVQDKLRAAAEMLRHWLQQDAVIYVCGSLHGMAAGIDATLMEILGEAGMDDLIAAGRYRRDVY